MAANTPTLHPNLVLSAVEQSGPRGYIRPLFFFPLAKDVVKDELMRMLQESLRLTREAVPMLTAELVADTNSEQKGRFHLRQGGSGKLYEKDIRDTYGWTYDQLREQNFPSSSLPEDLFCPVPVFPAPSSPAAVFVAQATMIEGGLVLNICIMHLCADARAIYEVVNIWSRNCLHIQDSANYAACEVVPEGRFTKEPFMQGFLSEKGGSADDHPEFVLFDEPPAPPPAMFKKTFRTGVFYFSTQKLRQLKEDASASLKDGAWISTHDAVCALIWRCVLAAQVDLKAINEDTNSLNTICVDGRLRSSPNLAEDHIGCPMVYATPSIDAKSTLASEDVGAVALAIRHAVAATDARYINSLVTWFNKIPSFDCLGVKSFGSLMGTSVMMSSWFKVPFSNLSWGLVLGDHCECVRTVFQGFFNGSQVIMPEVPVERGGGMEVVIGLDEENWSRFKQDKLWYRYAESR